MTLENKPVSHKKIIQLDKEGRLNLVKLLSGTTLSPEDVHYYLIEEQKSGSLKLALFDKDKNPISVDEKK